VTDNMTNARLQRIEQRVASLDDTVSILAMVDDDLAKERIESTFGGDPSLVLVYRGVQKKLTQEQTADALRERGLARSNQAEVSRARARLRELGFLKDKEPRSYAARDGWTPFGIERYLRKVLRDANVSDLA
jgi:hypothetical protein